MEDKKEVKNIYEKLSEVQNKLKAPKNQRNTFGNYNYRSAEDILEAVKPLLHKERLTLVLDDELVFIGERYYIKATATIYDLDTKESLSNNAYAREEESKKGMDGSQITGTASSYARKYALNGLFNIDDTKDADTDEYQNQTKEQPKKQAVSKATKKQIELLKELYSEEELNKALDIVKKENIEDLTVVEASSLISKRKGVEK